MSFLEIAQFFGGQFRDEKMKNKWHHQFDYALATKNRAGKKDRMTELLTVEEGIFGWFFMDTDILSFLYYDIHNQQRPIEDMPCRPQHMTAASWKKAVEKFVEETCDIIKGHYHCRIIKNGQIYPGCLRVHGYKDYTFQLLLDDPHANKTLAATMVADATTTVRNQSPKVPAATSQSAPTKMPPATQTLPQITGPDVIIEEEEVVKVKDEGQEPEQAEEDEEIAILSMIHAYQEAEVGSDESQDPSAGGDDSSTQQSVHPKGLPPHLEWIPRVGSDFPAHLSLTDKPSFTLWAESYPYETESQEVKALSFLPDYMYVATKVITRVLWAMVYVPQSAER